MRIKISERQFKLLSEGFSYTDDFGANREPGKIPQNRDIVGDDFNKTIIYADRSGENNILLHPEVDVVRALANYVKDNNQIFPKVSRVGSINRDGKLYGVMFFEKVYQKTFNVYTNKLIKVGVSMKGVSDFIINGYESPGFKSQRFQLYLDNKQGKVSDNLIDFFDSLIMFGKYVKKIKAEDKTNIVDWDSVLKMTNFGVDDNGNIKIEKIYINSYYKTKKLKK